MLVLPHFDLFLIYIYREVPEKDAKDYADSIHAIFVETSAKNAINISEVFIEISECVSGVFLTPVPDVLMGLFNMLSN